MVAQGNKGMATPVAIVIRDAQCVLNARKRRTKQSNRNSLVHGNWLICIG